MATYDPIATTMPVPTPTVVPTTIPVATDPNLLPNAVTLNTPTQANPTQILNQAAQNTLSSLQGVPATDPNAIKTQASSLLSTNVNDIQSNLQSVLNRQNDLINQVSSYLQPTAQETQYRNDLNNLEGSFERGTNAIRNEPDVLGVLQGQQAVLERQYQEKRNSIARLLDSETASREQKLKAAQFLYDANRNQVSDTLQLYRQTAPENIGSHVDEYTGKLTVVMKNPITGQVYTVDGGNVGTPTSFEAAKKFRMENNINSPFYTIGDSKLVYNATTGQPIYTKDQYVAQGGKGDWTDVQNLRMGGANQPVKFETKNIDGRLVHIGYDRSGNVVMQQELGMSGTPKKGSTKGSGKGSSGKKITPSKEQTRVQQIIRAHPGEWGHAADQIDREFGQGTATKYDDLLKKAYLPKAGFQALY